MVKKGKKTSASKKETIEDKSHTGVFIDGAVSISQGDFVGRDKIIKPEGQKITIKGNINGGTVIAGDSNATTNKVENRYMLLENIQKIIDENTVLKTQDKEDLEGEVRELNSELEKGETANEGSLSKRMRNIMRIAPDILDVIIATILNPANGISTVARKIAQRMKDEAL